jgi:putative transcriptional regulator
MSSFQGHFLLAASHQLDPNFAETVILVAGHTQRAAFGVIVNRSMGETQRLQRRIALQRYSGMARFFSGGPVTGPLMAVHTHESLAERRLLSGVFFSAKERNVLAIMRQSRGCCKIFTGYAGWGPEQLDYEVDQGIWRVVPALTEQIFSGDYDLWEQLSSQASRCLLRTMFNIRYIPLNPLLN